MNLDIRLTLTHEEYKAKVLAGEIRGVDIWPALKGGALYWQQWKRGDRASEYDLADRANTCAKCKHRTAREQDINGAQAIRWTCGQPAYNRDAWDEEDGTCGCLVGLSFNGQPLTYAVGMAACHSEECPLGKW